MQKGVHSRLPSFRISCGKRVYNLCVENGRKHTAERFLVWDNAGFSPIYIAAAISVSALVVIAGWQAASAIKSREIASLYVAERAQSPISVVSGKIGSPSALEAGDLRGYANGDSALSAEQSALAAEAAAEDSNDLSKIGENVVAQIADTYSQLQQIGGYTPVQGERIAANIAASLRGEVPHESYTALDFLTDPDTSYKRMLAYRADLQLALQPLLANTEPELEIFGRYIESRDRSNLKKLEVVAQNYREAVSNMKVVVVPTDALSSHMAVVNSLVEFAATLEAMAKNADDTMATLALLRAFNDGEQAVLNSFNALARYQRQKAT